jgi:hypothetical protein
LSTNEAVIKPAGKNRTRNLLLFTVATTGSCLAYYELALNAQEKRKIIIFSKFDESLNDMEKKMREEKIARPGRPTKSPIIKTVTVCWPILMSRSFMFLSIAGTLTQLLR